MPEQSPMLPLGQLDKPAAPPPEPKVQEQQQYNPYVDGDSFNFDEFLGGKEDVEAEPKSQKEGSPIDIDALAENVKKSAAEWAEGKTKTDFMAVANEVKALSEKINSIPHKTRDEISRLSEEELQELGAYKSRLESLNELMSRQIPVAHDLRKELSDLRANQVIAMQRQLLQEYPEYASRALELAAGLPPEQLSNPATYRLLIQQAMGERSMEQYSKSVMAKAAQRSGSSSAGGGGRDSKRNVTRQDVNIMRMLVGDDPKRVRRALGRYSGE